MKTERTQFYPTEYDMQMSICWAFDERRTEPEKKAEFTVPQLVEQLRDEGNPLTASEVRHVLGWLYGQGRFKVANVVDGEEVWSMSSPEDYLRR